MTTSPILTERDGRVLIVRLNRPRVMNALNVEIMMALGNCLAEVEADSGVGCVVLTGNDKAFAAGADIAEARDKSFPDTFLDNWLSGWDRIVRFRKPLIAAVSGYALGGGCELAMIADMIIASETARFGQPEIKLGLIPGMGGTQRLARAIGKAKAADLLLTGRMMDALEAESSGLVARVVPMKAYLEEAVSVAHTIAGYGMLTGMLTKESLQRAFEGSLSEGLAFERRAFHSSFGTSDSNEGIAAFLEKRAPNFNQF